MQGYLKKKSNNPLKKWQTRYFDLNRHILTYYETAPCPDEKQEPRGEFNMWDMKSLGIDPENRLVLVLNLGTSDFNSVESRAIYIKCPDNNFYQAWLSCFVVFVANDVQRCMIPTTFAGPMWILIDYLGRPRTAGTVGLFRIPGEKKTTESLRNKFTIRNIALTPTNHAIELTQYPITALASVLKCLIDRMPHTLLTERFYQDFITLYIDSRVRKRLSKLRALLQRLPRQSLSYIHHLCLCLNRVSKSPENKMDAKTLGILFSTMFVSRCKSPLESVGDFKPLQRLLEDLILNCEELFAYGPPVFYPVVPKLQLVLTNNWNLPRQASVPLNIERKSTFEKFISRIKWKRGKKKDTLFANSIKRFQDTNWSAHSEIIMPRRVGDLSDLKVGELPDLTFGEGSSSQDFDEKVKMMEAPDIKIESPSASCASSATDVIGRSAETSSKRHSSYIPNHSHLLNLDSAEMKRSYNQKLFPTSASVETSREDLLSTISRVFTPISQLVTPVNRYAIKRHYQTDDDDSSGCLKQYFGSDDFKIEFTDSP